MQHFKDEAPEYLAARLSRAIAEDSRTGELGIQFTIRGDHVYLNGSVSSHHYKAELDRVLSEYEPLLTVHNDVSVVEADEPGEPEVFN